MPFVSQMFGLVMEAESLARNTPAFRLCCSVSGKDRLSGGKRRGLRRVLPQTDLGNNGFIKQMANMY